MANETNQPNPPNQPTPGTVSGRTRLVAGPAKWADDVPQATIVRELLTKNVTVERHRDPGNPEAEVYQAVWNNGHDPLETHQLKSKGLREALVEAGGVGEWKDARVNLSPQASASPALTTGNMPGARPGAKPLSATDSAHLGDEAPVTGKPAGTHGTGEV